MSDQAAPASAPESPLSRVRPIAGAAEGPIIGIDLGTTYSCVAYVKDGRPFVIPSRQGYNTMPSIIAINARGKILVGHPAKAQMVTNPTQTIFGAKRLIGRRFHSPVVKRVKKRFHYEIVEGPRGEAAVQLGGTVFSLQEISAMLLVEAREIAEQYLGHPIQRAVITVPAYYNDHQRHAVREAGSLAGLQVERIINEPTAAALTLGWGHQLQKTVLVYDLGGGTFDASLLRLSNTVYEVVATGGDTFLGGVDFDNLIVDFLASEFQKRTGAPLSGGPVGRQRLIDLAEQAKRQLSEQSEARIQVPFVATVSGKPVDLDVKLTRADLERVTAKLLDRTIEVCAEVLRAGKVEAKDVEEILLVGGMSRMPRVHQRIAEFFGRPPHKGVHPDEAVALGAALFAYSLGETEGLVLIDVLPIGIGIGLAGGHLKTIIPRNTPLPYSKSHRHSTTRDNQDELELPVFQGDSDKVEEAEYLGSIKLGGLPKGPRGSVHVDVSFSLSAECLLSVTAREESGGGETRITLTTKETPEIVKARLKAQDEAPAARVVAGVAVEKPSLISRFLDPFRSRSSSNASPSKPPPIVRQPKPTSTPPPAAKPQPVAVTAPVAKAPEIARQQPLPLPNVATAPVVALETAKRAPQPQPNIAVAPAAAPEIPKPLLQPRPVVATAPAAAPDVFNLLSSPPPNIATAPVAAPEIPRPAPMPAPQSLPAPSALKAPLPVSVPQPSPFAAPAVNMLEGSWVTPTPVPLAPAAVQPTNPLGAEEEDSVEIIIPEDR